MNALNAIERRAVVTLASIFALRMVGLFMILPVFALYGHGLAGATPTLIGVAVGIYGFAQALLQLPLSMLSDRMDRKRLILQGLLLFALGGAVAALSDHIVGVIIGRGIQGAGAISGVVMALLADLTREERRTRAMATIGMSIGLSFALAFVVGPLLAAGLGLSGLFWVTAVMGLLAATVAWRLVPSPALHLRQYGSPAADLKRVLGDGELLRLNAGIFILHLVMTASFVQVPVLLVKAGLVTAHHGWIYLPVLFLSFLMAVPAIIVAEKQRRMKPVFLVAIAVLGASLLGLAGWHVGLWALVAGLFVFFIGFNLLEALLPSLVSKICPAGLRGTAMGLYATSQFLGAGIGGVLGGWLSGWASPLLLFLVAAGLVLLWWLLALGMRPPRHLSSYLLRSLTAAPSASLLPRLGSVPGVVEAVLVGPEGEVYLKVDPNELDHAALAALGAEAVPA